MLNFGARVYPWKRMSVTKTAKPATGNVKMRESVQIVAVGIPKILSNARTANSKKTRPKNSGRIPYHKR